MTASPDSYAAKHFSHCIRAGPTIVVYRAGKADKGLTTSAALVTPCS